MRQLDGARASRIALLSGLSREQLEAVGGVDEDGRARRGTEPPRSLPPRRLDDT